MTAITAVYPRVRIEAPGVPEPLLQDVVLEAIQDFFCDAEVWRYSIPTALDWTTALKFPAITAGVEIPADTRLVRLDVVKYGAGGSNFSEISFRTRQDWDSQIADWEDRSASTPYGWTNDPHGAAPRIVPTATANQVGVLKVRAIIAPASTATTVDDYFYEEFADIWRYGALARLMKMPDRDWTNLALASYYEQRESEGIIKAKSRAQAEYGQPNQRTMAYGGL